MIDVLLSPGLGWEVLYRALINDNFGVKFFRIKDWVKEVKRGREIDNDPYLKKVFETIEPEIREELRQTNKIVFEATG